MCTECCWCLCIHQVSFRGASYFFSSVHNYDTVSKLLTLVAKNILLRTYFMDSHLSEELNVNEPLEDVSDLVCKFSYYVSSLVTALLIFRGIEKEWRQIIQWAATVFLLIEVMAFGIQSTLYPDSFTRLNFTLTVIGRVTFVAFYLISLTLYVREVRRDENEADHERQWKIEPSYIYGQGSSGRTWGLGSLSFVGYNGTIPRANSVPKFKAENAGRATSGWNKKFQNFPFSNWNRGDSGFYFERFPKYETCHIPPMH
ncbi:unnamed protein product [Orchesella dallaii]|uniref:Uncharacterized protein n=1 Tax=Orchesella dallaii TaxID=48710 RepID=A0ABP1PRF1_9HEXA